jgi:hypothetical protein
MIPDDRESLQPLLEDGSIGRMIDPLPYAPDASEEFLNNVKKWGAAGLCFDEDNSLIVSKLHSDKIDTRVKRLFKDLGYEESGEWLSVPTKHASNYMLYLANMIGKKNQLSLITHEWAPWTATTYFGLNGQVDESINTINTIKPYSEDPFALFSLIVSELTPINIEEIPSDKIVSFRVKRQDEITRLRDSICALHDELQTLEDPVVREDHITKKIQELASARDEYQRSADIIKAKGWFGVSFMGFTAPVTLANFFNIPEASTVALAGTALALGAIFNIKSTRQQLETLRKQSPTSCLVELRNEFKEYTSSRGGGDMNFHAFNCMEEYVND